MEDECKCCLSRRELIVGLAAAGGAFALAQLPESAEAAPKWVVVAKSTEIKDDPKLVHVHGKPVYLFRGKNHKIMAISGVCTHKGCTVNWKEAQKEYVCPCHGAEYTSLGKNVRGPARFPLALIPSDEIKGKVRVDLNAVLKVKTHE